jgi:hypothetical protein
VSLWCFFVTPHLTTRQSNIGVQSQNNRLTQAHLTGVTQTTCTTYDVVNQQPISLIHTKVCEPKVDTNSKMALTFQNVAGSKRDNRSHSRHRRKRLLDCFGGQLDANTRISTDYAQNLPDHWD